MVARPPAHRMSSTACSRSPAFRATSTTRAPRPAACFAVTRPIPLEPPVMTITCLSNGMSCSVMMSSLIFTLWKASPMPEGHCQIHRRMGMKESVRRTPARPAICFVPHGGEHYGKQSQATWSSDSSDVDRVAARLVHFGGGLRCVVFVAREFDVCGRRVLERFRGHHRWSAGRGVWFRRLVGDSVRDTGEADRPAAWRQQRNRGSAVYVGVPDANVGPGIHTKRHQLFH